MGNTTVSLALRFSRVFIHSCLETKEVKGRDFTTWWLEQSWVPGEDSCQKNCPWSYMVTLTPHRGKVDMDTGHMLEVLGVGGANNLIQDCWEKKSWEDSACSLVLSPQITGLALASSPAQTTWPAASNVAEIWGCPAIPEPWWLWAYRPRGTGVTSTPMWTPRWEIVMMAIAAKTLVLRSVYM